MGDFARESIFVFMPVLVFVHTKPGEGMSPSLFLICLLSTIAIIILLKYYMKRFIKRLASSEMKSVIKTQTDQNLHIVPYSKAKIAPMSLPQAIINKTEKSLELIWSWGNKKTITFKEVDEVEVSKEGAASSWDYKFTSKFDFTYNPEYIYYNINVILKSGEKILIAKERNEKSAGSLATLIAKYLDSKLNYTENVDGEY